MRLVSYGEPGRERAGLLVGGRILDLERAGEVLGVAGAPNDMGALLAGDWPGLLERVEANAATLAEDRQVAIEHRTTRLGPPVPRPRNVICLGLNYRQHATEQGLATPPRPLLFAKASTSVIGPTDDIVLPESAGQVDYEVELAVVIGARAKKVPASRALEFVAGYMAVNDVSAREAQFGDGQWFRGKSFDTFCPTGPYLVTKEQVPDPHSLTLRCLVNGQVMQQARTSDLIFDIPAIIEFITRDITLQPGDIVATGTPSGVGIFRKPPVLLKAGDVVVCEVERIGRLENRVVGG